MVRHFLKEQLSNKQIDISLFLKSFINSLKKSKYNNIIKLRIQKLKLLYFKIIDQILI